MSTTIPEVISETNLSYAWARAFLKTMHGNNKNLMPLTISVGGLTNGLPAEDYRIRQAVDMALDRNEKYSCAISAMTIFPFKYWNQTGRPNVQGFTELFLNAYLPRLRARDSRNRTGTYFERMIAFQGIKRKGGSDTKNQLQHIIGLWPKDGDRSRPRQSALQVAIFDPVKDHNGSPRSVFPCLQQVSFTYDDLGRLAVNAYYPAQYIFDRAYGNYLGLCHLGYFMARELDLELVRMNCFIGHPQLGDTKIPKTRLRDLEVIIREVL
jgi:thymidylate synthase